MDSLLQGGEGAPLLVGRHVPPRPPPAPCKPVRSWSGGRRVHDPHLGMHLSHHLPPQFRTARRMRAQLVRHHHRPAATRPRPGDGRPDLRPQDLGRAARRHAPVKPAGAPVEDAQAVPLGLRPWGVDQARPAPPCATPAAGSGRLASALDRMLPRDRGPRQEAEQISQGCWHLGAELSSDAIGTRWRRGQARAGPPHRHPPPVPTAPGWAAALRLRGQGGRWQPSPGAGRLRRTGSSLTVIPGRAAS
jgi:hypothetical protein